MNCQDYLTEEEREFVEERGCFNYTDCRVLYILEQPEEGMKNLISLRIHLDLIVSTMEFKWGNTINARLRLTITIGLRADY